jgi:hypothetical protein
MKLWVLLLACAIAWLVNEWGGEQPLPTGWWWTSQRADTANCKAFADARPTLTEARPVALRCSSAAPGYVAARFAFPVEELRGKRVALFTQTKVDGVSDNARVWLRGDRQEQMGVAYADMRGHELKGTSDWVTAVVAIDVPIDASSVFGGIVLEGSGKIALRSYRIQIVAPDFQFNNDSGKSGKATKAGTQ